MRSLFMSGLFASSSPSDPPADLHSKVQAEPPHRDKFDISIACMRSFSASKTLQQVLGFHDPEQSIPPPPIANSLTARFEDGLQLYGQLGRGRAIAPRRIDGYGASQQGKPNLADIAEEKESPSRSTPTHDAANSASGKLRINVPQWTSDKQAVAVAQRYTFLDSDSDATNDDTGEHTDHDTDKDDSSWKYESSTTLAIGDFSGPGSAVSDTAAVVTPSFPPRTSSLFLPDQYHGDRNIRPSSRQFTSHKLPRDMRSASTQSGFIEDKHNEISNIRSYAPNRSSSLKRAESLPALFPSPGVDQPLRNQYATQLNAVGAVDSQTTLKKFILDQHKVNMPCLTPQITGQAPPPVKAPTSRKRAPSSSTLEEFGLPLHRRIRRNDITGLPIVSLDEEMAWKADCPGNTFALLTTLLHWSHAMWTFYNQLPDPKLFSLHPAFPYPVTPPIRRQLLSVSFYNTSVEPQKEVRFLGPGDAAEISYHEVDVFADAAIVDSKDRFQTGSSVDAIKQSLHLAISAPLKHTRYLSMSHRAKTGEGRWCYVLVKGNQPEGGGTPPHIMLAWHVSAMTAMSDCLHTIYRNDQIPSLAVPAHAQVHSKIKRFSSLQNFSQALRGSTRNIHQTLRSASSSSELPVVDTEPEVEKRGGVTLLRTVVKLEKAGCIPLVEGYRVDVSAFREWLEACGQGEGKVVMWRERDAA